MRPIHSSKQPPTLSEAQQFRCQGVGGGMRPSDYFSDEDRTKVVEEVADQLLHLVKDQFPRTKNLEYVLLKTHVIIDHAITQFIRCTSQVLVEPESLRFRFSEKVKIAMLHGFGLGCPISLPSLELLNKVRNQVAHRLTINQELVNELIRLNSENIDPAKLTDVQRIAHLRSWCAFICGQVVGSLKMIVAMTMRT